MQAAERALAEGGRCRRGAGELRRARDDGRHERDHRGQDRAQRLRHHRGLPRPARDRPPGAAVALRHPVREDEAARAARSSRRRWRSGSARRARCCARSTTTRCATRPRSCGARSVESVAVCLLHAYVNPEHEQRVGAILAEELPGIPISLSSEVAPEFREYLRASTTVINAVIRPVVERYLQGIESRLADGGRAGEAARDAVERRHLRLRCARPCARSSWSSRARRPA